MSARHQTIIREARRSDIPRLVAMGGRFIRSSSYAGRLADNSEARAGLMRRLIDEPYGAIFVSERRGKVMGMIGVCAYPHLWSGQLIGSELFWWVDPEARGSGIKLLRCAEEWMERNGCSAVQMIAPNDRVARVYKRLGYAKLEEGWQRAL